MLIEVLALVISYCGIFVGYGLSKVAPEEVKASIKNLISVQNILFFIALAWFFFIVEFSILGKVIVAIILIALETFLQRRYALLGIMFGLSPDFITSSIVFLYGLPAGSLLYKKTVTDILKENNLYVLFGVAALIVKFRLL